jgi:hypothetical protein
MPAENKRSPFHSGVRLTNIRELRMLRVQRWLKGVSHAGARYQAAGW